MRLNYPKTIPTPWSVKKLSFTKPVRGAKKVGDCYYAPSLLRDLLSNTQALKHPGNTADGSLSRAG